MTPRLLQLQRREAPQREPVAWFIAGGDPRAWLAELCRWGIPQEALQLFVAPASAHDRQPGGLLVIPSAAGPRLVDPRALALGSIEGKLFLPIDAALHPPVTPAEAGALCSAAVTLFHPGLGLVEFEAEQALHIWDLLEPPALTTLADWNSAQAGTALNSRLAGVALLALPEMDDIFGEAQKQIGSEPMTRLPERSGEPSSGAGGRIGRALASFGASAVTRIFSLFPSKSPRGAWINDALDWAAAKLAGVSREMEELRHQELHRLMDLLESDPERGLRHALPLADTPSRGRAAPGAHLGPRDPRFDLGRLGGGRPADPWSIPPDLRKKLTARYRELALQEQRLGRFRRAAYIHAELLGDLSAAAAVLVEGRLFAEAGVLYRDHLRRPLVAAECFVEGGLFAEAIALYEKQGAYLELGDLHRKLGDEAAAAVAYRRVVEAKVAALDFLGAAELLEGKLHAPDEALALLGKGWPHSPQAAQCLHAEFALLGRLGRHEQALRRLAHLREEPTPATHAIPVAKVLGALVHSYPDRTIWPLAADLARVKIAPRMAAGDPDEIRAGVLILSGLNPEDRLLSRDGSRFLAARLEAMTHEPPPLLATARPRKPGSGRVLPPKFIRKFQLPKIRALAAVKRCGRDFVAAAFQNSKLIVLRGDWAGFSQTADWSDARPERDRVTLVLDEQSGQPDFVVPHLSPEMRGHNVLLARTGRFREALQVTVPVWMPDSVLALSVNSGDWWILRGLPAELVLELRDQSGRLISSAGVTHHLAESLGPLEHVSLLVQRSHVWLALNECLFLFHDSKTPRPWGFESSILGLASSAPFLTRSIVVRCESGAAVLWSDYLDKPPEIVASDLQAPHAAFLGNGSLVLLSSVAGAGGFAGRIIDLDRRGLHSSADFTWNFGHPMGLVATDLPNEFAIFTKDGEVHIHRVPLA